MYIYFRSFLRMLYPYLMFLLLENTFSRGVFVQSYREKRKTTIFITGMIVLMAIITMLISCQFRYGLLVVGSESMTGSIDKGDVVFFESYHGDGIRKGDIIIYNYHDIQIIHRVVEIKSVNGEIRYYTKGDKNSWTDPDYRVSSDIVGVTKFRLKYLGHPTLWLNRLFN